MLKEIEARASIQGNTVHVFFLVLMIFLTEVFISVTIIQGVCLKERENINCWNTVAVIQVKRLLPALDVEVFLQAMLNSKTILFVKGVLIIQHFRALYVFVATQVKGFSGSM